MQKTLTLIFLSIAWAGCTKFTDPGAPGNQLTSQTVFNSDATATSALLGIYAQMEASGLLYNLSVATGLTGDEMINYNSGTDRVDLATNNIRPENTITTTLLWNALYNIIYRCNSLIDGLSHSAGVAPSTRKQLTGEALFLRAYCHFYLLQLFGDIPLVLTPDYQANANADRDPESVIYDQLEKDLEESIGLLLPDFVGPANQPTSERTRPNRFSAIALMARVFLYEKKWTEAEATATLVINETAHYRLVSDPGSIFLKNSEEALWQLEPKFVGGNTYAGALYPFNQLPMNISMDPRLVNLFPAGDQRRSQWFRNVNVGGVDYYYAFKYQVGQNASSITEYTMVIRLAELYLIRAEARARQSNFNEASADVNMIRQRAGLPGVSLGNLPDLLHEIEMQRQFELFAEAGDRWIDLRRTGRLDPVMSVTKGSNWAATDQLYPIPQNDRNRNPNLSQNPGY